ncbi:hypothetical protein BGZ73_009056 [Actinomortierella ambigua]|nr:hypothetical protein BGZ73_009056 [Actinomortierella ambigua]
MDTTFADGVPLYEFTVRVARQYLDDTKQTLRQEAFDAGTDDSAPVYGRLRWKNGGQPFPDEWWDTVFKRLHSPHRNPKEKQLIYLLAHRAIHPDGVKAKWAKYRDGETMAQCKRCLIDTPDGIPRIEDLEHAIHHCSSISSLWDLARGWIKTIFPHLELSGRVDEDMFCWPQTAKLPAPAIYINIHTEVLYSIWRTYTAIHKLQPGQSPRGWRSTRMA